MLAVRTNDIINNLSYATITESSKLTNITTATTD